MSHVDELHDRGVIAHDVELGPLTTYKAGGPARLLATVGSLADLEDLVASGLTLEHDLLVLGRGSNLLVSDSGFDGLAIRLTGPFTDVSLSGSQRVEAGGAAPLPIVARTAVTGGVLGLEFFVGVPGSVGGAVRQNAGCFGVETSDRLINASIFDLREGTSVEADPSGLELSYRHSNLAPHQIVTSARFQGRPGDPEQGKAKMREITRWRRDNQPGGTLNAGSVFKNPPGDTAGGLIDRLGLKGMSVGQVSVSDKHANFFVAGPGATSADIRDLVMLVKTAVFERSGTMLEPEIQFVGFE